MASLNEVSDLADDVDYYAWLGVDKSASKDEIQRAYRKLSRVFHPDKHRGHLPQQHASQQFNKIKRAYEVLTNPLQRAIYDTAGLQGLRMEGWQIQERYRSAKDILDEIERMKGEEEEKKLRQCTNAKGSMSIGVNATDIFDNYEYNVDYPSLFPSLEISETQIRQSVECPLTRKDTVLLAGSLSAKNGKGSSEVGVTYRKVMNEKLTGEAEVRIGSKVSIGFSCFRNLWKNGSGNISTQFQLTPDGSIAPFYTLNMSHQFDKHTQGRISVMGGLQSAINTSLFYLRGAHLGVVGCQLGVPASFLHCQYSYSLSKHECKLKCSGKISSMGWMLDYHCSKKITKFSTLSAGLSVGLPSGVVLKIGLSRGTQTFSAPIHLSECLDPSAIFYGTFVPIVSFVIVKKLIVQPYLDHQLQTDLKTQKERHAELLSQRKEEAAQAVDLMSEMIHRSYEVEEEIGGLVVERALYGKGVKEQGSSECIEVGRCLQSLVKNSCLTISPHTKLHSLPGFYDPCYGEQKELLVEYTFRHKHYRHVFREEEEVVVPSDAHLKASQ